MSISLYEVLKAGRGQFGILEGVSFAYLTLCSPRSGPRAHLGLIDGHNLEVARNQNKNFRSFSLIDTVCCIHNCGECTNFFSVLGEFNDIFNGLLVISSHFIS